MMRTKPFTSMQKTYDECYLICSTAIYFERQENEAEALRSWRSALNQIYHHNAYLVPAGYIARTETERALQDSLREMELQCKERVDVLDALEASRKEAEKEAKKAAKEERAALRKGDRNASTTTISSTTAAAGSGPSDGWIGNGTIPPVNYEDLSRPPALPARPSYVSRIASSESVATKSRTKSLPQLEKTPSPLPAPPTLPVPTKKTSRSPSPDQRRTTMLTTLRKGDGKARTRVSGSRNPPAASKAAGLAWDTKLGPSGLAASGAGQKASRSSLEVSRTTTRNSIDEPRPVSDDDYRKVGTTSPSPSDYLPQSSWREPQNSSSAALEDRMQSMNVDNGGPTRNNHHADEGLPSDNPFDEMPPPPPPHSPSPKQLNKPKPPPPRSSKAPELSYRREYPPATLRPGATSIGVKRPSNTAQQLEDKSGGTASARKPLPNSSTPRSDRVRSSNQYMSTSSGSEDNVKPQSKPAMSPRRKAVRQNSKQKQTARAATPPSSEDSSPGSASPDPQRDWERRSKAIMRDLPRGVDEAAARQILNEIVIKGDEVHWSDIAGLEIAKKALKEAVVYPFLRPDLFMGLREPARGMLLFGPPGTGKTMLARAVATESKSTFFAISASSLTSKWHGDSEKLVRALFALAKRLAPSIIFVDEIDSLLSARSSSSEHEASRRSKTEFLIQWSDLQRAAAGRDSKRDVDKDGDPSRVLVLAATNVPWDIDDAARRRFVRRQYIPLPEAETRGIQLRTLLSHQKHELTEKDIEVLVRVTEGFSGSDITSLAKDAAMGPLRNLGEALLYTPMDQIRPIRFTDFDASLNTIRPSVSKEGLKVFEEWASEFGERGG